MSTSSGRMIKNLIKVDKKPIYKHQRHLERSVQQFKEDFKDLDSTKYAESMDFNRNYFQPPLEYPKPLETRH